MKNNHSTIYHRLLAVLAVLLLAAPGARAQSGTTASPDNPPIAGSTTGPASEPAAGVLISNKIQFHGQVPDTQTNYRASPLDVCPNVVDPATQGIQSQPYQFEFESNCLGNSNSWNCRFRPNFIWTIKYFTETGATYTEQWQDVTAGDFSKIRLYLYDRVPYTLNPLTPTNGQATQAGGNANFSAVPYPNLACLQAPDNTAAQPGDFITNVQLECTGYSCGFTQGDDSDVIQIRYYGRRPSAITVNGATPLCRNTTYPISVSPVFAATNYLWYTAGLNGAVISGVNGNNATLDVSGVPAGTNSITLRVAAQDNAHCGNIVSATRELVVSLVPGPAAPQNMQLSNGLCPTTSNTKSLSVTGIPNAIEYTWTLSGAGAYFDGSPTPQTTPTRIPSATIITPQAGQVTATVAVKLNNCNGYGATLSRTFQIGNLEPVCIQPGIQRGRCDYGSFSLVFETNPTGLNYYFGAIRNVTNGGMPTITQSRAGSPVFLVNLTGGPSGRFAFDLDYYVQSPCPSGPGFTFCTTTINIGKFTEGLCLPGLAPASTREPELFPNPSSGTVEIRPAQPTSYQWLKVYDMKGSLRHERHSKGTEGIQSFDIRSLATGIYQVQLFDGQHLVSQRLVKE